MLFYPGAKLLCPSQSPQMLSRVAAALAKAPFKYYCLFWRGWTSLNWELELRPVWRGWCDPAGLFLASLSRGRHVNPGRLPPCGGNKTRWRGCVALKIERIFHRKFENKLIISSIWVTPTDVSSLSCTLTGVQGVLHFFPPLSLSLMVPSNEEQTFQTE